LSRAKATAAAVASPIIAFASSYDKRALYYWAKLYTEQLKTSDDYGSLCKAIGIHILNFTSIPEVDKYHTVFHIKEKESGILYFKDLELHTIELKKFSKNSKAELPEILTKVKNSLDMWVAFLTRHDLLNKDHLPPAIDNPILKKALDVLDIMSFGAEERESYEEHLKWLRIEANTLKKYEAKGFAEGEVNGFGKGEVKGQRDALLLVATKMFSQSATIQTIALVTGLSHEELEQHLDFQCDKNPNFIQ
jgi:predicted transposase/invertase (TIGR01784 family)